MCLIISFPQRSQLQGALQEVSVEREEKLHALKQCQHLKESCSQAIERQHAAEERLATVIDESKQAKVHADTLIQCYKVLSIAIFTLCSLQLLLFLSISFLMNHLQQQLEDLKTTHQKRIATLTEQLENLQTTITVSPAGLIESGQASSVQSNPSPVADWAAQITNSDSDLAMRSLQREEGEVCFTSDG